MSKTSSTLNSDYYWRIAISGALLLGSLLFVASVLSRDEPYHMKMRQFEDTAEHIQAITLGNSHNIAVHFKTLDLDGMHFQEDNGDIEEALRKADVMLGDMPSLRYVFMTLSPGSLQTSQRHIAPDYIKRRIQVRKNTPHSLDLSGYVLEEALSALIFWYFPIEHLQSKIYQTIGYDTKPEIAEVLRQGPCFQPITPETLREARESTIEEGMIGGYRRILMAPECLAEYAIKNTTSRAEKIRITQLEDPGLQARNIADLVKLANRLDTLGARLIIVLPPVTKEYYQSQAFVEMMQQHDAGIQELRRTPAISVLDHQDLFFDVVNESENAHFYDDSHLALPGSIEFSRVLKRDLEKL